MTTRFKIGDRVKLSTNLDEGWEEEFGSILDDFGSGYLVQVDKASDEHDDCLRDVTDDQISSEK